MIQSANGSLVIFSADNKQIEISRTSANYLQSKSPAPTAPPAAFDNQQSRLQPTTRRELRPPASTTGILREPPATQVDISTTEVTKTVDTGNSDTARHYDEWIELQQETIRATR